MIQYDSINNNSFINGPLRKEGLSSEYFLFPVGRDNMIRWVALRQATGNFTVEYVNSNPRMLNAQCATGIDHISSIEYWTIESDANLMSSANVELSFADPNSGGVTDLSTLRVARLTSTGWNNVGNSGVTGTPGSKGSVTSDKILEFPPATKYITLAGSTGANSLPLQSQFPGKRSGTNAIRRDLQMISLSPSIVTTAFMLTLLATVPQNVHVMITDASGSAVRMISASLRAGTNTIGVNVSSLTRGCYQVNINDNGGSYNTLRFVKL